MTRTSTLAGPFALALALALGSAPAHADGLVITTVEHGWWPASVSSLQTDVTSEGRTLHVQVLEPHGRPLPCGSYSLAFDPTAAAAFALGSCNASTGATELRLVHRSELFDRGDLVAYPRHPTIYATQSRTGASAGGASVVGGSEATCSIAVKPYLTDLETGARVYLTPGRFVVRTLAAGVSAEGTGQGWTLHSGERANLAIEYEVFDTVRSRVVVRDRATLVCMVERVSDPEAEYVPPTPTTEASAVPPAPGAVTVHAGQVVVDGATVVVRGTLRIQAGGSLVIRGGGSMVITR